MELWVDYNEREAGYYLFFPTFLVICLLCYLPYLTVHITKFFSCSRTINMCMMLDVELSYLIFFWKHFKHFSPRWKKRLISLSIDSGTNLKTSSVLHFLSPLFKVCIMVTISIYNFNLYLWYLLYRWMIYPYIHIYAKRIMNFGFFTW